MIKRDITPSTYLQLENIDEWEIGRLMSKLIPQRYECFVPTFDLVKI